MQWSIQDHPGHYPLPNTLLGNVSGSPAVQMPTTRTPRGPDLGRQIADEGVGRRVGRAGPAHHGASVGRSAVQCEDDLRSLLDHVAYRTPHTDELSRDPVVMGRVKSSVGISTSGTLHVPARDEVKG